jgi:hypothetical protein
LVVGQSLKLAALGLAIGLPVAADPTENRERFLV